MAFHMVILPYIGDGTERNTLKFPFQVGDPRARLVPKMVQVRLNADGASTASLGIQSIGMLDDEMKRSTSATIITNGAGIRQRLPGGFSVGKITGASFGNHDGEEYIGMGMFDDNDLFLNGKEFECGSYVGDGSDDVPIQVGFQPVAIHIWFRGARNGWFWFNSKGGDAAAPSWGITSGNFAPNNIQSVSSAGFVVGSGLYGVGGTYYWMAWRDAAPRIVQGKFAGTGSQLTVNNGGISLHNHRNYREVWSNKERNQNALQCSAVSEQNVGDPTALTYMDSNFSVDDGFLNFLQDDASFVVGVRDQMNESGFDTHWVWFEGDPLFIPGPLPPPAPTLYSGTDFTGSPYHVYKQNKFLSEEFRRFKLGPG